MSQAARAANGCGVIFDMDGVLVDSYAPHLESWRRLAAEIGRSVTNEQFDATFGRTSREIIDLLFGPGLDGDEVRRLDDRKEALYRDLVRGRVPVMPGAPDVVRSLYADGLALAVGSSGPPANVSLIVEELRLTPWLSATVTGADVQRGKPDPQVFQIACQRLGLPPRRCAVVEDAPVGIEAARRAGCRVIALSSTHPRAALQAADCVVDRLGELSPARVRKLLADA